MARRWRSQPTPVLLPLVALVAAGCTYDWLGVEPSGATGGMGGAAPAGGTAGDAGAQSGGAPAAGAGGGSAAAGTPSSGGQGGSSDGGAPGGVAGVMGVEVGGAGAGAPGGHGGSDGVAGGLPGGAGGGGGASGGASGDDVCPGNLVQNGGFEAGLTNWIELSEEGGSRYTMAVTTEIVPSGAGALSIDTMAVSPPSAADYRLVVASSRILVSPGEALTLSAQIGAVAGDYGLPAFGIQFFDLAGDALPDPPVLVELTAEAIAPIELQVTVPGASTSARVIFELHNDIVLIGDDVCLVREP